MQPYTQQCAVQHKYVAFLILTLSKQNLSASIADGLELNTFTMLVIAAWTNKTK